MSGMVACVPGSTEKVELPEREGLPGGGGVGAAPGDQGEEPAGAADADRGGGERGRLERASGERCGPNVCGAGEVCCNESCGYCTPPGGVCTKELCLSGRPLDGSGGAGGETIDPPPEAGDCASDADCRLSSRYCGGCECLALAAGQPDPPCLGPSTQCFADPCRDQRAVCAAGRCTTVIE